MLHILKLLCFLHDTYNVGIFHVIIIIVPWFFLELGIKFRRSCILGMCFTILVPIIVKCLSNILWNRKQIWRGIKNFVQSTEHVSKGCTQAHACLFLGSIPLKTVAQKVKVFPVELSQVKI